MAPHGPRDKKCTEFSESNKLHNQFILFKTDQLCEFYFFFQKTRMELRNDQIVILRGCAKYNVCNGRGINNAPVPIGEVKVDNYCCQDAYCNSSLKINYNLLLLLTSLCLSVIYKVMRL